jgi:hypothetical protein
MKSISRKQTYRYLRSVMAFHDCNQADICNLIHVSESTITNRFSGKKDWTRQEMHKILDYLNIPKTSMYLAFPADIYEEPERL